MALTVRFPNGVAVKYNEGKQAEILSERTVIYDIAGHWIAQIINQSGIIVEAVPPCTVWEWGVKKGKGKK